MRSENPWQHWRRYWLWYGLSLLVLLAPVLVFSPVWDLQPVEDTAGPRPERRRIASEENTFVAAMALMESVPQLDPELRNVWVAAPQVHQEDILDWLQAHAAFAEKLREIPEAGVFQLPEVNGGEPFRLWTLPIMETYRFLNERTLLTQDWQAALARLEAQVIWLEYLTEIRCEFSILDGLVHQAGRAFASGRAHDLLSRWGVDLTDEAYAAILSMAQRLERLDAAFWTDILRAEFWHWVEHYPSLVANADLGIPRWMPRRSSFFFQPNRTARILLDIARFHEAKLQHLPPPTPWATANELDLMLHDPGIFRVRPYFNLIGKAFLGPFDMTPTIRRYHADVRMVKLRAALLQFWQHHGIWPERLEALVPKYLDAVPLDPFDGQPLRYDAQRGLLWSVHANQTDNGGSTAGSHRRNEQEDFVFGIRSLLPE